jgi:hypothetical protein
VLQNLRVNTELAENGADESQNASKYYLTWCIRGGALNVGLKKTNKYKHNAWYVQY